ncbi:DUF4932 domain-containing protein [Pedobacter sp.]|uniref:DUF4932 domain-containing protein n=1 Tax=Pedobacter sp. TaxID=1411316 RepID=UPI0031D7DECC
MNRKLFQVLLLLLPFCVQAQNKVNFSNAFKKQNQGKYKIEIHQVKELVHIMIAITASGRENDDMIQQQGQYYKEVLNHFKPFSNEKIIKTFDSLMNVSPYYYIFLTGNAISYDFNGGRLQKSKIYDFPATGVANMKITENPITRYKAEIEAFAQRSKFREFYKKHQPFYDSIIAEYNKNANLGKQWKWLEKNFDTKIGTYLILCSPLVNGLNYTTEFDDNNFRLIQMVLPTLDKYPNLNELQNEILNTRVMFTEIDHNYVNPPSNANATAINKLFADRSIWIDEKANGAFAYPNGLKVFNEYMTFGVFLLYCKEYYNAAAYERTYQETIQLMKERGFPKMKEFTDQLLATGSQMQGKKIDSWYPDFLKRFE